MILNNKFKSQKGISLYFALTIMTIFLAISLGLSTILLSQIKMIRGIGYSVIAFYAGDTGIEEIFYLDAKCFQSDCESYCAGYPNNCSGLPNGYETSISLDNGASYEAKFSTFTSNGGIIYTAESTGLYEETKRALEASYGD